MTSREIENPEIRKNKIIDDELRKMLIKKVFYNGMSIKEAALLLEIPYGNAKKIIEIYEQEDRMTKKKTGKTGSRLVTPEVETYLVDLIELYPDKTLEELKLDLRTKFLISISTETIRKTLGDIGITRKRVESTLEAVNSIQNKERRREYARDFMDNHEDDSLNIFIDETGFNLHLRRTYARSRRGTPDSLTVPTLRGTNISLIQAINRQEVIYSYCKVGSVKSTDFLDFFKNLIDKCREKGYLSNCCFFMDNASIHRANLLRDFFRENNLTVKFLSPYSYMLNPIEYSFSKLKSSVKRILTSSDNDVDIIAVVNEAITEITPSDLEGYFRHMRRNCTKAVAFEDF